MHVLGYDLLALWALPYAGPGCPGCAMQRCAEHAGEGKPAMLAHVLYMDIAKSAGSCTASGQAGASWSAQVQCPGCWLKLRPCV